MKDVLFKAKALNGDWVHGLLSRSYGKSPSTPPEGWYISNRAGMPWAYAVRPETICRYTTREDKYGNRIWQGDVIKIWAWADAEPSGGYRPPYESVVKWNDDYARFDPFSDYEGATMGTIYEVIGNIHDNDQI